MQGNTIVLAVDKANSGVTTDESFSRFEEQIGRSTYTGPGHTVAVKNTLQMYRTMAKRSGNFLGSTKTSVKFTLDCSVSNADGSGTLVAPMIVEVNFSVPVGVSAVLTKEARQRVLALLDQDAVSAKLVDYGEI